jgi:uncharacterized RDD family membrane protein YckC
MSNPSDDIFRAADRTWQDRLQGVPLATFRSRALAFLLDGSIIGLIVFAPTVWSWLVVRMPGERVSLTLDFGGLLSAAVAVLYFGLLTYFGKGATLGKRVLGIRVVSLVERDLSLWHSFERALGYAASSLELGFGFLQYFRHPNRQTVHDRIAETVVIVGRAPVEPSGATTASPKAMRPGVDA